MAGPAEKRPTGPAVRVRAVRIAGSPPPPVWNAVRGSPAVGGGRAAAAGQEMVGAVQGGVCLESADAGFRSGGWIWSFSSESIVSTLRGSTFRTRRGNSKAILSALDILRLSSCPAMLRAAHSNRVPT